MGGVVGHHGGADLLPVGDHRAGQRLQQAAAHFQRRVGVGLLSGALDLEQAVQLDDRLPVVGCRRQVGGLEKSLHEYLQNSGATHQSRPPMIGPTWGGAGWPDGIVRVGHRLHGVGRDR